MSGATVKPSLPFEPTVDAENLKKALKGLGTDETVIINILANRNSIQRQEIIRQYRLAYDKDLVKDLKHDLHGKFEDVIVALMTPMPQYLAQELRRAMKGKGTKEKVLVEILCTNDTKTLSAIKEAYHEQFGKSLTDAVKSETSGDFKKLLEDLVSCDREDDCRPEIALNLAKDLYDAGEGKLGTDEDKLRRILTTHAYSTLRLVFQEYNKLAGKSFEDALKNELSGDFLKGMLAVYSSIQNPAVFFAHELHTSMQGLRTRNRFLIRLVVSRSELDLNSIKTEYHNIYSKTLEKSIKSETHGDYKKLLLAIIES